MGPGQSTRAEDDRESEPAPDTRAAVSLPQRGAGVDFAIMLSAAPVRSSDGELCGILTLRIDPERGFTEILHRGRMGESGESYAFSRDAKLISESRFDDDLRRIGLVPEMGPVQKRQRRHCPRRHHHWYPRLSPPHLRAGPA